MKDITPMGEVAASKDLVVNPEKIAEAAQRKREHLLEVMDIPNTMVATILEHDMTSNRVTGLVHLGDKLVKITKRRDRGLTHETGLDNLLVELAEEDLEAGRADLVWQLGL